MIRLRVSDLDQWVRFIEPEREEFEVSTEDFLAYMNRVAPESEDMLCGKAFHSLLEKANVGDCFDDVLTGTECEGFRFHFDADLEVTLPMIRESSVEKIYQTPVGPVLLRGKLDGEGLEAVDYKLTTSTFDAERYAESLQWKAYLDMTGASRFRYLVFESKRNDAHVFIRALHEMPLWSYPGMHEEVARRVGELAEFVSRHVPRLAAA